MLKKELILPQSSSLIPSRLTIGYDFSNRGIRNKWLI